MDLGPGVAGFPVVGRGWRWVVECGGDPLQPVGHAVGLGAGHHGVDPGVAAERRHEVLVPGRHLTATNVV